MNEFHHAPDNAAGAIERLAFAICCYAGDRVTVGEVEPLIRSILDAKTPDEIAEIVREGKVPA
jgi:hypothetical protein